MNKGKWSHLDHDVEELFATGQAPLQISKALIEKHNIENITAEELRQNYVKKLVGKLRDKVQYKTDTIETDKRVADFDWRRALEPIQALQKACADFKGDQDYAAWKIKTKEPICVMVVGDLQLGSWATDYDLFRQVTDQILNTPNLYVILVGDLIQMAIKMRGVLEVMDNILPPKFQMMFLDSWLQEIKHKVIASTWDNHAVMREEDAVGYSNYAEIFKRHTIYFNHIGHLDIHVNDINYRWAVSHFFQGRSEINPCHAPQKYMRLRGQDRDICFQGDYHVPGLIQYMEGGKERIAGVCGSIQTNSGYAKRFFDLKTAPVYPCVILDPNQKVMTPLWSVAQWIAIQDYKHSKK